MELIGILCWIKSACKRNEIEMKNNNNNENAFSIISMQNSSFGLKSYKQCSLRLDYHHKMMMMDLEPDRISSAEIYAARHRKPFSFSFKVKSLIELVRTLLLLWIISNEEKKRVVIMKGSRKVLEMLHPSKCVRVCGRRSATQTFCSLFVKARAHTLTFRLYMTMTKHHINNKYVEIQNASCLST